MESKIVEVIFKEDKLFEIIVDGSNMEDLVEIIKDKAINDWFKPSNGRDGYLGFIEEIENYYDVNELRFYFDGPEAYKMQFIEACKKHNISESALKVSDKDRIKDNYDQADLNKQLGRDPIENIEKAAKISKDFKDKLNAANEYYIKYNSEKENSTSDSSKYLTKAIQYYKEAATLGSVDAQKKLFYIYYHDDNTLTDKNEALKWCEMAAKQGDEESVFSAAMGYFELAEDTTDENLKKKATDWVLISAKDGNPSAQYVLAECYTNGYGVDEDEKKAFHWYSQSAEQGKSEAQYELAECYKYGYGVDEDEKKAFYWYTQSANQENVDAQYELGNCYAYGFGVEEDWGMAAIWYRKAAIREHAEAQFELGGCYNLGYGIEESPELAFKWYKKSSEQGYAEAQYELANCYAYGYGTQPEPKSAFDLYEKSAAQDNSDAMVALGKCYLDSFGVVADEQKALKWLKKAAELDNDFAVKKISDYYATKFDKEDYKDKYEAINWFEKAEKLEHLSAIYKLAECYHYGIGKKKDRGKVVALINKAAQEDIQAYAIGAIIMLRYSEGTIAMDEYQSQKGGTVWAKTDLEYAREWLNKGIELNDSGAQSLMGQCYEYGIGTEKSGIKAYKYYTLAAENEKPAPIACYKKAQIGYMSLMDKEVGDYVKGGLKVAGALGVAMAIPVANLFAVPAALIGAAVANGISNDARIKKELEGSYKYLFDYYKMAQMPDKIYLRNEPVISCIKDISSEAQSKYDELKAYL